jgi:hypothetical protein
LEFPILHASSFLASENNSKQSYGISSITIHTGHKKTQLNCELYSNINFKNVTDIKNLKMISKGKQLMDFEKVVKFQG